MKVIKIILAIVVLAVIGFFSWKWIIGINPPPKPLPPTNPFTERIEKEIDSLSIAPINVFCQQFYKDIQYRIDDYYKKGLLNTNPNHNEQWFEILSKDLYSAYAPKFVEQAMHIFSGSVWKIEDLKFIRSEAGTLQSSVYLDTKSTVAKSFENIRSILAKYDEIERFISTCNNFSYSHFGIGDRFPDVSANIKKSRDYLAKNLENTYVNNCTRLKNSLREIPQKFFDKHISYLRTKIAQHANRYKEIEFQPEYFNTIYTPLRNQIDALSNNIYGIINDDFNRGYNELDNMLRDFNRQATDYFLQIDQKT